MRRIVSNLVDDLPAMYRSLAAVNVPIDWPPDTEIEDQLFDLCALIFVVPTKSERALKILRRALGGKRCEYLLALLAFVRTARFWTLVHPDIEMEDDVQHLMAKHKELAVLLM
jgi:hypothetical protein